mmetsp:Transcript_27764/g.43355  ORF Transcript_27764/g.43355 Transcript_27764/m.43355 type:complete len:437 (-) Transcript_27764:166-1476(-)
MAEVSVQVETSARSPMPGECSATECLRTFGSVKCKKEGSEALAGGSFVAGRVQSPDSSALGLSVGDLVVTPQGFGAKAGDSIQVSEEAVVGLPSTFTPPQAAIFPSLVFNLREAIQSAGIKRLSDLKGRKVFVIGGTGPTGSVAIQLLKGVGADVSAAASKSNAQELRDLGANNLVDYKTENFFEALSDLEVVVDCLSTSRSTGSGLISAGVQYAAAMNPAVALVFESGIFAGGLGLRSFEKAEEVECGFEVSAAGFEVLREAAEVYKASGAKPSFSAPYTASEWLEASGWPKDADTGARYGFPGASLWAGEEDDQGAEPEEEDIEVVEEVGQGVLPIESQSHFSEVVSGSKSRVLLQFVSPTCRACKAMSQKFKKLPTLHQNAAFGTVNIAKLKEIAEEHAIVDVPSYVLYVDGEKRGQWRGSYRVDELSELLNN